MKTLNQILGGVSMTATAQAVKRGLPDVLPANFLNVTRRVAGNAVRWNKIDGGRELARIAQYGSPAQLVNKKGIASAQAVLAHCFEFINHDPLLLQNLQRQDSPELQQLAIDEIDRQTADFMQRANSLRLCMVYSTLANGKVWFDSSGNLLFTSSGAAQTVDFGVPAANQNQVGGTIDASWATSSTDIIGHIQKLKKTAVETTGYPLEHAFYGANISTYIAKNDAVTNLLKGSPTLAQSLYGGGEIPDGFCGLHWHPASRAFGVDSSGNVAEFFAGDALVLTPEPSPEWWEVVEGSYMVPRSIDVAGDALTAVNNLSIVYGKFSYGVPTHDPVGVKHYAGDTFLPLLKVPSAIFQVDVTP